MFSRYLFILLCLLPGLGIILALIGFVTYIVFMQSVGLNNIFGEDEFTLKFWEKTLGRKSYNKSVQYSLYIGTFSIIFQLSLLTQLLYGYANLLQVRY